MKIRPITDGNSNFDLVEVRYRIDWHDKSWYSTSKPENPHNLYLVKAVFCKTHGAMNKVSTFGQLPDRVLPLDEDYGVSGYWRCLHDTCRAGCIEDVD